MINTDQQQAARDLLVAERYTAHPLDVDMAALASRFAPVIPRLTKVEIAIAARCRLDLGGDAFLRGIL